MKIGRLLAMWCAVSLMAIPATVAQTKKEKEDLKRVELRQTIDSEEYTIDVSMAYPQTGKSLPLTNLYSLTIKNDSLHSNLPYFGRAYSVPYGGGKGLIFDAPLATYEVTYTKKGVANIRLSARTEEDTYNYYIKIYPGGSSNVKVNMINRQSIDFSGRLSKK